VLRQANFVSLGMNDHLWHEVGLERNGDSRTMPSLAALHYGCHEAG
jgi:hypothetical protein